MPCASCIERRASGIEGARNGRRAKANNNGAFVWGDSTDADVTSSATNQFIARASGGVTFFTSSDLSTGVTVAAGGGSWSSVSDRNLKENVVPVDGAALLARLDEIPIATWNYKTQDASIRHLGPMAQDFYAAFGLGTDNKRITTVDADGVALAALQALYRQSQEQEQRLRELKAENEHLKQELAERVGSLEAELALLRVKLRRAGGNGTLTASLESEKRK